MYLSRDGSIAERQEFGVQENRNSQGTMLDRNVSLITVLEYFFSFGFEHVCEVKVH